MNIPQLYKIFVNNGAKVSTDSRNIPDGALFFALRGEKFDGNKFAKSAIEAGASYAVVDNPEVVENNRFILVENSLETLQQLALYHRKQLGIPVLAITGTAGKTTTKELTAAVLSRKFNVAYTQGNLNNQIGVPLTLLSIDKSKEFAVIEMGASHPGDIRELCEIADPDYGLITNIGTAHIEGFGSHENLILTKTELYRYLEAKDGLVFVNKDNQLLMSRLNTLQVFTYGTKDADVQGEFIEINPLMKFRFKTDKWYEVQTNLFGEYNFENALAAVAIGHYFGIDSQKIKSALEEYYPKNNRSQLARTDKNILILDLYNANPTSMAKALESFARIDAKEKAVIIGDMLELGEIEEQEHRKILSLVASLNFDKVFLVGKIFSNVNDLGFDSFMSSEELVDYLKDNPLEGKTVLLKASRGIHLEKVADVL